MTRFRKSAISYIKMKRPKGMTTDRPAATLDPVDLALISELQKDGRLPLTELSGKLGVSHGTVRNRLEKLIQEGLIKVAAVVDPAKVGLSTQLLLGINADLGQMLAIEKELARFPEVYFVSTTTGRLDFLIAAAFPNDSELRQFLARRLSTVEGIRATETFHILHSSKRLWEWEIPARRRSVES
ncbi:MAG: Lrp/AsnC family transcriptional regulator [Armatimonadota bacterium]